MEFIQIEDMSYVYHPEREDEYRALDHINLSIKKGEFVAILGTNGSGKSTLAKHLNALLLPTDGVCRVAGMGTKQQDELWKIRQEVGMVFQNPDNQIIAAVVEEDVAFGPENLGVPTEEIRQRVSDALKAVGMSKFRNFAPHLLSGGQKQRVAIARALIRKPDLLLADEPTGALDEMTEQQILMILKRFHQEGNTLVIVTHDDSVASNCSRQIHIRDGQVV